eukprot:1170510-Amphidinium_carterae.2
MEVIASYRAEEGDTRRVSNGVGVARTYGTSSCVCVELTRCKKGQQTLLCSVLVPPKKRFVDGVA